MKITLFALLLIPFLSFAQLSEKDKQSIDLYAVEMCDCINNLIVELHPKTTEVIMMMAEEGKEAALKKLEVMILELKAEEQVEFFASFARMEDPEFTTQIEECDDSVDLDVELKTQIENSEGEPHDYLLEVLDNEETCKVTKALYDLGTQEEPVEPVESEVLEEPEVQLESTSTTSINDSDYLDTSINHGKSIEFSDSTIESISDSSGKLNSLAWHAYEEHNDITVLLKAIDLVEKSIELDRNYYNVDTLAALLYKTGNYTNALKKAKEAIILAKESGFEYDSTTELINKIIDKL